MLSSLSSTFICFPYNCMFTFWSRWGLESSNYLVYLIFGTAWFFMEFLSGLGVIKEYSGIFRFSENGKKSSPRPLAQAAE